MSKYCKPMGLYVTYLDCMDCDKNKNNCKAELLMCENANIDTGHRKAPNRFPVFTTKEKCLEWLKQ